MNNEEKILQMLGALTNKVDVLAKKTESDLLEFRSEVTERFDRVETQQRENTDVIKAIRHNQEHIQEEINTLKMHTAIEESTIKIRASINALNERIFMQDTNIQELKLVNIKSTIAEINDKLELLQAGDRVLNRRLFEQEANVVGIKRKLHHNTSYDDFATKQELETGLETLNNYILKQEIALNKLKRSSTSGE